MIEKQVKMLKTSDINFQSELKLLLNKGDGYNLNIYEIVIDIIKNIRKSGDKALLEMVKQLDGIDSEKVQDLKINQSTLKLAYNNLQKDQKLLFCS